MAKPGRRRIPSDDCIVPIDGIEYAPHEGEWVEVVPGFTVGDLRTLRAVRDFGVQLDAIRGEPDQANRTIDLGDDTNADLCRMFSQRILDWNWTDDTGAALPKPHKNPDAFLALRAEELYYLVGAVQGATAGMLGKDGSSTPTSSSATRPPQSRESSARGRNR